MGLFSKGEEIPLISLFKGEVIGSNFLMILILYVRFMTQMGRNKHNPFADSWMEFAQALMFEKMLLKASDNPMPRHSFPAKPANR
jgi:hypothetical protein